MNWQRLWGWVVIWSDPGPKPIDPLSKKAIDPTRGSHEGHTGHAVNLRPQSGTRAETSTHCQARQGCTSWRLAGGLEGEGELGLALGRHSSGQVNVTEDRQNVRCDLFFRSFGSKNSSSWEIVAHFLTALMLIQVQN